MSSPSLSPHYIQKSIPLDGCPSSNSHNSTNHHQGSSLSAIASTRTSFVPTPYGTVNYACLATPHSRALSPVVGYSVASASSHIAHTGQDSPLFGDVFSPHSHFEPVIPNPVPQSDNSYYNEEHQHKKFYRTTPLYHSDQHAPVTSGPFNSHAFTDALNKSTQSRPPQSGPITSTQTGHSGQLSHSISYANPLWKPNLQSHSTPLPKERRRRFRDPERNKDYRNQKKLQHHSLLEKRSDLLKQQSQLGGSLATTSGAACTSGLPPSTAHTEKHKPGQKPEVYPSTQASWESLTQKEKRVYQARQDQRDVVQREDAIMAEIMQLEEDVARLTAVQSSRG